MTLGVDSHNFLKLSFRDHIDDFDDDNDGIIDIEDDDDDGDGIKDREVFKNILKFSINTLLG